MWEHRSHPELLYLRPVSDPSILFVCRGTKPSGFVTGGSEVQVPQLCLTFCDSMSYTVHGTLQAKILEWVAFPFSRGSF